MTTRTTRTTRALRERRDFLRSVAGGVAGTVAAAAGVSAAASLFPESIRKALAIPPHREKGTIEDVQHVVILMQENRSFDHYFGTLRGVRGFADRFPIPLPDRAGVQGKTVWFQSSDADAGGPRVVTPFRLNTEEDFDLMRVQGTPHSWPDAQGAWAEGKLDEWSRYTQEHSLGYFARNDLPFQFALAEAFTISDAYHCAFQGGTNPNRVFAWSGHNDPEQSAGGPVIDNAYDNLEHDPDGGYRWTTYCERLQAAGVSWQVYQDMEDNFTDNPLAGFASYRAAVRALPGSLAALEERGLSTRDLDQLHSDVRDGTLPQVSWIVATAEGSEHPGPSSPAQGAAYTARVLDALTANPEVWSKTVLFLMFDENDGFFDHVPPPAPPSYVAHHSDPARALLAGASTVDTAGEYHEFVPVDHTEAEAAPLHRPYGLGPRVPLYVISPWSTGGWVHSQVSDHTSLLRFVERRFGVEEPNISAWRRAVCSDLTGAFDFSLSAATDLMADLPGTTELAQRARTIAVQPTPEPPRSHTLPVQELGTRPSRALPYALSVGAELDSARSLLSLTFDNHGRAGAVFHVYDRRHLERVPRRYTVEAGKQLRGSWTLHEDAGVYDLWVLGPGGFFRHFVGVSHAAEPFALAPPELRVGYDSPSGNLYVVLKSASTRASTFTIAANAYFEQAPLRVAVAANTQTARYFWLRSSGHWYDFSVTVDEHPNWLRRFAGRVETGLHSISDPAQGGPAHADQPQKPYP